MELFQACEYENIFKNITNDSEFIKNNPIFFHDGSKKLAVIIDTRFDIIMEGVIRNFMYYMNPNGWNLMIYGCSENKNKITTLFDKAIFREISEEYITTLDNGDHTVTIENYNKILMNCDFWESLPYENICIFQRDCVLYKMFPEYFSDLYDYAGANYYSPQHISFFNGGIQGGLSFRKKQAMIDCIKNINWDMITNYRKTMMQMFINLVTGNSEIELKNEDIFFTYACEILHKNLPDRIHRSFLSIESDINYNTSAMHGWTKYLLPKEQIEKIIKNSTLLSKYYDKSNV